jgi:anaerobic selenocysteine-containing dehydrogenase
LPSVARKLREPHVFIQPEDAEAEGISDGDLVEPRNKRGAVELVALVSGRTQPRVLVSDNGYWGQNVNATTSNKGADLGGQTTFHSNWVGLEAVPSGPTPGSEAPA